MASDDVVNDVSVYDTVELQHRKDASCYRALRASEVVLCVEACMQIRCKKPLQGPFS